MRLRGKRSAAVGLPLIAIAVIVGLVGPRPARDAMATGSPRAVSASATHLVAVDGSPSPTTRGDAPTTGPGEVTDPTMVPAGPTLVPTAIPTTRPTAGPTTPPSSARPTVKPTPAPTVPAATPGPVKALSACPILPSTNVWNRRVDTLPVAANSAAMIAAIGLGASLHPDFSNGGGYGIPYNLVGAGTPRTSVTFQYADESDPGPYPIPAAPKVEGGSDRHLLMVDTDSCTLFELFAASSTGSGWTAGSGAIFDLRSNELRPAGWTSADAAGLPILPGLVRYTDVAGGAIDHAIRFTAPSTCHGYVYPATHQAGSGSCDTKPPMGLRVRLNASVDVSGFGPQAQVVLRALQRYGMLLADNGSPWYITGAPSSHWDDDDLHGLGAIQGSDFEVVDTTGFVNG